MDQKFIIKYNEAAAKKRGLSAQDRHKSYTYAGFSEWSRMKDRKKDIVAQKPIFKIDMDDLQDYLQEILDKHHVPGDFKHGNDFHYSSTGKLRENGIESPAFYILNIPENAFLDLYGDLIGAWDNIEKRLSHKIMIDYEDTRTWLNGGIWPLLIKSYMIIIKPVIDGEIKIKKPFIQRIKKWMNNEALSHKLTWGDIPDNLSEKRKEIGEILLNLSDCLQEIFDKYSIPEGNTNETMYPLRWWILNHKMAEPQIMIGRFDVDTGKKVRDDIVKIKSVIEKRIGHSITIRDEYLHRFIGNQQFRVDDEGVISVKLTEYMVKDKPKRSWFNRIVHNEMRNAKDVYMEKLSDLEELEDYLQEIFDRFQIRKVGCLIDTTFTKNAVQYIEVDYGRITIDNVSGILSAKIMESLKIEKDNIEKRMGKEIGIISYMTFIRISIIQKPTPEMINNQYLKTESLDDEANDLEDYLQEVFDKYGIVKTKKSDTPTQASYYINSKNQIDIDNILDYNGKVDYRMTSVIYNEIMRIKPTIEKRLGTEIEVEMETEFKSIDSGGYINITNTGKKIDKYNEGKTRYNMEDLEDYLQEFFDRFNILKIKNTQDLWDAGDRLCYIADKYSIVIENIPIPEMFGNVGEKGRRDPKEIMDELVKELNEIIPNIEKRFGFYIKIKPNIYGGWISIEPDKIIVLKN